MDDQKPGTALTVAPTRAATMATAFAGLMPTTIGEAFTLAGYLAKSGVIPKSLKTPDAVLAVMMAGMELGLTPLRALQSITIISGNMAMKTDLQLALARRSGALAYHDEGFELKGQTDTTLAERAKDGTKILQLVALVPAGKPYGWCTVQRTGEDQLRTYVFTWLDAERVMASEWEETGDGKRERTNLKLSEKHNYKHYPQSMYPRRARGAVLQVVFGDVLAGLPAVEALEGQVLAADYSVVNGDDGEDLDALMAQIEDAELNTGITAGFEHLAFNKAKRLQLLTKWKDNPQGLYDWLRNEKAQRLKPGAEAPPKKKAAASHPVEVAKPVDVPAAETPAAPTAPEPPDDQRDPGVGIREGGPAQTLKDIAAQFKPAGGGASF
jgi:hypothetical protein